MDPHNFLSGDTNIRNAIIDVHLKNVKLRGVTSRCGISYCSVQSALGALKNSQEYR